jgi:hypothetical protein
VKWYGKYGRKVSWKVKKIWRLWKKPKSNSEKIWKIQKNIVKWFEKYGGKVGWNVKWYGKYGRKASWNVKW